MQNSVHFVEIDMNNKLDTDLVRIHYLSFIDDYFNKRKVSEKVTKGYISKVKTELNRNIKVISKSQVDCDCENYKTLKTHTDIYYCPDCGDVWSE